MKKRMNTSYVGEDSESFLAALTGFSRRRNGSNQSDLVSEINNPVDSHSTHIGIELKCSPQGYAKLNEFEMHYGLNATKFESFFGRTFNGREIVSVNESTYMCILLRDELHESILSKPFGSVGVKYGDQLILPYDLARTTHIVKRAAIVNTTLYESKQWLASVIESRMCGEPYNFREVRKSQKGLLFDIRFKELLTLFGDNSTQLTPLAKSRLQQVLEDYGKPLQTQTINSVGSTKCYILSNPQDFHTVEQIVNAIDQRKHHVQEIHDMRQRHVYELDQIRTVEHPSLFGDRTHDNGELICTPINNTFSGMLDPQTVNKLKLLTRWQLPKQ